MSMYYADELEPKKEKKVKEKKEKVDCTTCGNRRSCKMCQIREDKNISNMKGISLHLFQSMTNKWIPEHEKKNYLNELRSMIDEMNQVI